MFGDGSLTFREFIVGGKVPLARIQDTILAFLRDREDAVLFGAQAVNAYAEDPRMSEDVDVLSTRAEALAEELRAHLAAKFRIAVRVRSVAKGRGYRIYDTRDGASRHLADVRGAASLPSSRRLRGVLVISPPELIASKVMAYAERLGRPKSWTDRRDIAVLFLAFPGLKTVEGPVRDALVAADASTAALAAWADLVAEAIPPEDEDAEFA